MNKEKYWFRPTGLQRHQRRRREYPPRSSGNQTLHRRSLNQRRDSVISSQTAFRCGRQPHRQKRMAAQLKKLSRTPMAACSKHAPTSDHAGFKSSGRDKTSLSPGRRRQAQAKPSDPLCPLGVREMISETKIRRHHVFRQQILSKRAVRCRMCSAMRQCMRLSAFHHSLSRASPLLAIRDASPALPRSLPVSMRKPRIFT